MIGAIAFLPGKVISMTDELDFTHDPFEAALIFVRSLRDQALESDPEGFRASQSIGALADVSEQEARAFESNPQHYVKLDELEVLIGKEFERLREEQGANFEQIQALEDAVDLASGQLGEYRAQAGLELAVGAATVAMALVSIAFISGLSFKLTTVTDANGSATTTREIVFDGDKAGKTFASLANGLSLSSFGRKLLLGLKAAMDNDDQQAGLHLGQKNKPSTDPNSETS